MAFNEDTSFIEYPVDQPTQDFVTNFDTIGGTTDVVLVTVDGVLTDTPESSYTVQQINHTTWRVTPEVQIGAVVRLYRVTNIDEMMHVFTAGAKFIARNMDSNFKQIRHAQQEVRDAFDYLEYNTLGVVEAARDATDRANNVADEVERLLDKELDHNDLRGRDAAEAHPASAISYGAIDQEDYNNGLESIAAMLAIANPINSMRVYVKSYHPVNYAIAEPYFARGGGYFEYNSALVSRNDGGVVFNGWVRLDIENLNVNDFGAKGNWNARLNFGDDDTVPFEKYAAYITTYGKTPREGATRIMRVLSGSYRLKGFTMPSTAWGYSFALLGEGQMSQLWFDPSGTGIDIQQENVNFKDIVLSGKLNPTTPHVSDPAIPYIVKIKLASKGADVDFTCDNVEVHWFDRFARVAGRGFTFKGGNVGVTGFGGTLCEIACDADMVVGTDPAMQDVTATMRHFKVSGTRFDFCQNIFKITGTHAVKDYINGLTVESCELTGLRTIVSSDDCRLIKPKFVNNLAIASFQSEYSLGAIVVPRAIEVLDANNSWNYIVNPNHTATGRLDGISYIHRYTSIEGLTVIGSSSKDLIYGFIETTGATNNVKILDSNFSGFGDIENDTSLLRCDMKPTNIKIRGNTITSKTSRPRKWIRGDISGSNSIVIKDNICDGTFPPQALTYTPKLRINNADSSTASYTAQVGFYWVEGDYIHVRASIALTETSSSGAIGVSLPVPTIAEFPAVSGYISGSGELTTLTNFNVSNSVLVAVSASTDQTAKLMLSPTTQLNLSQKTANNITIACSFKYRFK